MQIILVIGVLVVLIAAYFNTSGVFGDEEKGPIASGTKSEEVRNPQPVSRRDDDGGGLFIPPIFLTPTPQPNPPTPPPPPPTATPPSASAESPWRGEVRIAHIDRSGSAATEYIRIYHSGARPSGAGESRPVDVTGWRISSTRASRTIPRAYDVPEVDSTERNIVLSSGAEVVLLTGTPSYQRNFRENSCVGYLTERHLFRPGIGGSCPRGNPDDRVTLLRRGFSGACVDFLERIPACRQPILGLRESGLSADCTNYATLHHSYIGCVANYRRDPHFYRNHWRVFWGSSTTLFDTRHDIVTLRDSEGRLVDEFIY